MAIREALELDLSRALAQLDDLERELDALLQPVTIPVTFDESGLTQLRNEIRATEDDDITIDVDSEGVDEAEDEMSQLRREVDRTEDSLEDLDDQADKTSRGLRDVGDKGIDSFKKARKALIAFAGAFALIQGGRALLRFFGDAISGASDLAESTSKAQVVFGDFFDDIRTFAETAPQALGLANREALEFTGTFGNLFVALGLTQAQAAELSPEIVQLGADLASFNNIETTDALDKLRAGLLGEAEPLRVLGISLSAARTQAKAFELGLVDANGVVSEAAKVQARYAIILEDSAVAQGDFARTADGIANRQKILNAEFETFKDSVGEALVPAFEALLDLAPEILDTLENLIPVVASLGQTAVDAAPGVLDFITALGFIPSALADIGDIAGAGFNFISAIVQGLTIVGFAEGLNDFEEGIAGISRAVDRINVDKLRVAFVDTLQAGVAPAVALGDALFALTTKGLDTAQIEEAGLALAELVDIDPRGIEAMIDRTEELGTTGELTAENMEALLRVLRKLRTEALAPAAAQVEAGIAEDLAAIEKAHLANVEAVTAETQAARLLASASRELGISVGDLLADTANLPPELLAAAELLGVLGVEATDVELRIMALGDTFGILPAALDAAGAALRDEEDEIVTDFTDFLANLESELAAREAFESNLALLRAFGLDDLSAVFEQAGLDAAAALADAVANPAEARRAEGLLDDGARGQAEAYIEAFRLALEGQPITDALIDNLIFAAEAADTPAVRAALAALAAELSAGFILTPTFADTVSGDIPDIPATPPSGEEPPADRVVLNFFTEPDATTDTARITQSVSNILR